MKTNARHTVPMLAAVLMVEATALAQGGASATAATPPANRFAYLTESDPFYVGLSFAKLATPQWIGEPGVEAVVILSIDDLSDPAKHEAFLRPILERLKQIDGRAPVSVMCNQFAPTNAQFQTWLREGLSLEVHTVTHRHPILCESNFVAGAADYHDSVTLLNRIPGNKPVAVRLPYCDSWNVASPRFYAEIFNRTNAAGQFLGLDSSVMHFFTTNDPALPRALVTDAEGRGRFHKYLPAETNAITQVSMKGFATTIADYPYPYVIGGRCWEFPIAAPSDWEAHNAHGSTNPVTVADWQAALDAVVFKQGVLTLCFHPHGWMRSQQIVEFIDYAARQHGSKVKFLTFREALERLDANLLAGNPLRDARGDDDGVRLLDVNHDGWLDAVIGNSRSRKTRVWQPQQRTWRETDFPTEVASVRFGVVRADGHATALKLVPAGSLLGRSGAWHFNGTSWVGDENLVRGLNFDGEPVLTADNQRDRGVRFRDLDLDGRCELLVANETQNAIFKWSDEKQSWVLLDYALPKGATIVDAAGRDAGLRFVDFNEDGYDDVVFSNEESYLLRLFVSKAVPDLGWKIGWNDEIVSGPRTGTAADPIPPVVSRGEHRNNGAWFHAGTMIVQNEDTAHLPDKVDRRPFRRLLRADQPPPLSPRESFATLRVHPGFTVELVAQEPLTMDPVAFEWGEDGRLWVAEMGDYPLGLDGHGKPGGVVRFLEDINGDGVFDKSTVFLDRVNFPNGVMPWRKGVLVSAAPEVFYAEDTDGDGRADVRKVLFTGFTEGNQQHRVNGFDYGLDNFIHAANGDSGGNVRSLLTGREVNIRGRDVRFRPDDGALETTAGQTQYGRHRDDWGNWFGNNNVNWLWHYYLPEHYLVRNPHLPAKNMKNVLAQYPDSARIFPISRFLQRFNWPDAVNLVTAASAAMPCRDELFGPDFASSVFICDPVYNVVHREVLVSDGVTFTSHRATSETNFEFFASSDNWCRPVFVKFGPDGALYVADMYRYVIEHPEWIPERMQKRLDLRAGDTMGRIYRVYPTGTKLRPSPRLDRLDTAGLVAALDHPSGWQRDTAQRLLLHRRDKAAVPLLERLARESSSPKARIHAICTLEGLGVLTAEAVLAGLRDTNAYVREHAVRVSEVLLKAEQGARLGEALLSLVDDPAVRVRYQLAFTLGEWRDPRAARVLEQIARKDFSSFAMPLAVMSSAVPHVGAMLEAALTEHDTAPPAALLEQLIGLSIALGQETTLAKPLARIAQSDGGKFAAWQYAALGSLLDALDRRRQTLVQLQSRSSPEVKAAIQQLDALFTVARDFANPQSAISNPQSEVVPAVRLLGRGLSQRAEDVNRLSGLLTPQVPPPVQQAALYALGRVGGPRISEVLLTRWRGFSPALRVEVLNILFSRSEWLQALLAALEREQVPATQIDPAHQQTLLTHAQAAVRDRAAKLFTAMRADRQAVIKSFERVLELKGDPANGAPIFEKICATCHQLRGKGVSIGADLGTVADKPVDYLLTAILDPNRAVEARYISYTAVTKDDREFSGIITVETPNSITLRNATGEETILRTDLTELTSSSLSLMPEGLEAELKAEDVADLIAFIKSSAGGGK